MFFIDDNGIDYRVDKEEFGCSIKSYATYVEGNEIVYEILELIAEKDVDETIEVLLENYDSTKEEVMEVMETIAKLFSDNNILVGIAEKINSCIKEKNSL